jgi:hypothetical protein
LSFARFVSGSVPVPAPGLVAHRADVCLVNQLNCRRLDRKFNVLEGVLSNYYFMVIFAISGSKRFVMPKESVLTLCSGGRSDPYHRSWWRGFHRPASGWSGLLA